MLLPSLDSLRAAAAIVHRTLPPTPQICWPLLSRRAGTEVWVKHENHQPVGAFKIRGGLVYMEELIKKEPDVRGVIAATRGNHGQSIAFAATRAGLRPVIVVPKENNPGKNEAMRALKAELIEYGNDFQDALEHAASLSKQEGLHFIPSFDEALVRGVASYSLELFSAVSDLDTVYVPIGLGSGICGAIAVRDALRLKTEIVGVTAEAAPAYARSLKAGRPVDAAAGPTIADGMSCRVPNERALKIIKHGAARIVTVSETEIRQAMRHLFTDTHNVAEGAGAAALAAALKEQNRIQNKRIAVILTGGNADRAVYADVLKD